MKQVRSKELKILGLALQNLAATAISRSAFVHLLCKQLN